jgi:eukaryotic-like serine/threonine-protein kinase
VSLTAGTRLGSYEILAPLGAGGMGEVWRARDTKLGREVALKVLPASVAQDPERLARFEREAQVLASLNHAHIAAIHGVEDSTATKALVLELVEGPTLQDRLAQGALPVPEAIAVARQIADALATAHERGIVHRDLKPANIKVDAEGNVKVLDFGLAKALDPVATSSMSPSASPTLMNSPTLTAAGTQLGVILGTAAYMAPEQARGAPVDKRADIWAFGALLYEMLSGRRLFAGETVSDTLAAVLRADPDWSALPADTPASLRRLLARCLERDRKRRLHDIGDAVLELDERPAAEPAAISTAARASAVTRFLPWALVALLAGALGWQLWRGAAPRAEARAERSVVLALTLPQGLSVPLDDRGIYGQTGVLAISPDGQRVVVVANPAGKGALYLRDLDSGEFHELEGTAGASSPFFSPDGRWVGYFSPGKLRKISISGGRPVDLADASLDRGGVWCPDGSIVYSPTSTSGLFRLPREGGAPVALTQPDVAKGERTHRWPAVMPGGREVAFTVGRADQPGDYEDSRIDAVDLATGKRRPLLQGASMVRFTPTGVALLGREGQLLAVPLAKLDGKRVEDPQPVVRDVGGVPASGVVHFAVADDGTLIYTERDPRIAELKLSWIDRQGRVTPAELPSAEYRIVHFAPDGKRVALGVGPGGGRGGDVWVHEIGSGTATKLTFDGRASSPIWTRDGKSVTYASPLPSGADQFSQRVADGSQAAVTIAQMQDGRARAPVAWMPDGSLLFWEDGGAGSGGNLLYLPPGGGESRPFAATPAIEIQPAVSPDGRYVAYIFDDTGSPEVHVQPFPPTGAKWVVAQDAADPIWSLDGQELDYVSDRTLMAAPVSTHAGFSVGAAHPIFDFPSSATLRTDTWSTFDLAPDGRFLFVQSGATESTGSYVVVVLNWFAKLEQALAENRR